MFALDLYLDSPHFFGDLDLRVAKKNNASRPDGEVFRFLMYDIKVIPHCARYWHRNVSFSAFNVKY